MMSLLPRDLLLDWTSAGRDHNDCISVGAGLHQWMFSGGESYTLIS